MEYRVTAIDPGPVKSAVLEWDGRRIYRAGILENGDLLARLKTLSSDSDAVAIEHLQCYGMAVGREVFETAYYIGRLTERSPVAVARVYRSEVKMHHCQSMRAKDSNIRQALIDRFGAPGTKAKPGLTYGLKADLWSAFAIAVYHYDQYEFNLATSQPQIA